MARLFSNPLRRQPRNTEVLHPRVDGAADCAAVEDAACLTPPPHRLRDRLHPGWLRQETSGAVSAFIVVLLPVLLIVGGMAVDVSQINAQKRDTQALADLAALAAAPLLPDRDAARARAQEMMAEARPCAPGARCAAVPQTKVSFLTHDAEGNLVAAEIPGTRPTVVRVEAEQRYQPILLGRLMGEEALQIRRSATAEQTGSPKGFAGFTLRNQLLSINTRNSILDTILSPLGVALSVDALGSDGLANARVKLDRLLGLATAGLALEAVSFNDVLQVPIALSELLGVVLADPFGKRVPGITTIGSAPGKKVTLAEIFAMSPQLLNLKLGDVLPDVDLGLLDILLVAANLAADPNQRLGLGLDLTLIDKRLGGASIGLGLIRSHATGFASAGDLPRPHGSLRQTDLSLTLGLLSIVRVDLVLGVAGVEADLVALNCQAREGSDDILAAFDVRTYPLSAFLSVQLLNANASLDATLAPEDSTSRLLAPPTPFRVNYTRADWEQGRVKRDVQGGISLKGLGPELQKLLKNIKIGPDTSNKGNCGWNILNCIIEALTGLTAKLVGLVLDLVSLVLPLDQVVNFLLSKLGVNVAGGTIILEHIGCDGENLGPARLIG